MQSTSGVSVESRNSMADGATSSKPANDNGGESGSLMSSSETLAPSIDEDSGLEISEESNSKAGESATDQQQTQQLKRKSFANSDDLSESNLVIDEDWDALEIYSNPVFESPKQNEVFQGRLPADESPSSPPAKMPRVAAKSPKSQPNEQGGYKTSSAQISSKKSLQNKRTGSVSSSAGRPNSVTPIISIPGKSLPNVNQSIKNNSVPSLTKINLQTHKPNLIPPAKGGNPPSKIPPSGTLLPTPLSKNTNPLPKSNPNNPANPNPQKRNSSDGSCNNSDQENNGAESSGGKTDVLPPPPLVSTPGRQGLLQPQNNNLLAAVRQNSVLDQVMITDVTSNLVTVTVLECWTSHGFFRDRGDPVSEPNLRS